MRSVKEADVRGKRVLVRVDFNVPLENGKITDDTRIRAALPTIEFLRKKKAKIILMSHVGRPNGKVVEKFRMEPIAKKLAKLLKASVYYCEETVGSNVEDTVHALENKDILVLENLRFKKGEEKDDEAFAKKLAVLGELYVNDAFGTCHRKHASVVAITKFLPSYAGLLLEKELKTLSAMLKSPKRPFVAVMGGIKVKDKIGVIKNLLKKVDAVLIGSAMASHFYKSIRKKNELSRILKRGKKRIMLPVDVITARSPTAKKGKVRSVHDKTKEDWLDIGPETQEIYTQIIAQARTVFWNGPLGVFENTQFAKGTRKVAKAIAACKGETIVGGGDSVAAVKKWKLEKKFTHLSTGGGASLKFIEGKTLPGIKALK